MKKHGISEGKVQDAPKAMRREAGRFESAHIQTQSLSRGCRSHEKWSPWESRHNCRLQSTGTPESLGSLRDATLEIRLLWAKGIPLSPRSPVTNCGFLTTSKLQGKSTLVRTNFWGQNCDFNFYWVKAGLSHSELQDYPGHCRKLRSPGFYPPDAGGIWTTDPPEWQPEMSPGPVKCPPWGTHTTLTTKADHQISNYFLLTLIHWNLSMSS